MADEKNALLFTSSLFELVSSKLSVSDAVKILSEIDGSGEKIRRAAAEISESLGKGSGFYSSLEQVSSINFPRWYLSFVSVSENSGGLDLTLFHLKEILEKRREAKSKLVSAAAYPVFVAICALFFGIFAFFVLSDFQAGFLQPGEAETKSVFISLFPPVLFLLASYFCIFFVMKKVFGGNSVILVFKSLGFLTENSVSVPDALKNCFCFSESGKNLEQALLFAQERIERGEKISESFSKSFLESGFKNVSRILDLNLSICEKSGKNDGFSKTCNILEEKRNKRIEKFLSVLNPALMFITAAYLWLILREIFLPAISGFGGF